MMKSNAARFQVNSILALQMVATSSLLKNLFPAIALKAGAGRFNKKKIYRRFWP
jgi:hypothetical protein